MSREPRPGFGFPTTHWSVVQEATNPGHPALNRLLEQYRPALLTHLRYGRNLSLQAAEDVLQSFCADRILEKNLLAAANPARGRFRSFLCGSLDNFLRNTLRDQAARKRAPIGGFISIEELEGWDPVCPSAGHPSHLFDLAWAIQVLEAAARRMQHECAEKNRTDVWAIFEVRILKPILEGGPQSTYADLVRDHAIGSPEAACNLLTTGKRMFRRNIEAVISEYAPDEASLNEECEALMAAVNRSAV